MNYTPPIPPCMALAIAAQRHRRGKPVPQPTMADHHAAQAAWDALVAEGYLYFEPRNLDEGGPSGAIIDRGNA